MALNGAGKQPQLLDTLLQLNELVGMLSKSNIKDVIQNIKAESENLKAEQARSEQARVSSEMAIVSLKNAEKESLRAAEVSKQEAALSEQKKQDAEKAIKKLQADTVVLDAAKKAHAINVEALDKKVLEVAAKEAKVLLERKAAEGLKAEYEKKMTYLKNIPV